MDLRELDGARIMEETADSFAPVAASDGKTLIKKLPDTLPVKTDESMLRQLLTILTDNAVKYCDGGGTVTCAAEKAGKQTVFRVSNTYAEGKDTDYRRFFDRFYRADASHNTEKGGYGIGLSIAESLAGSLGGIIDVSWKDGTITFTVSIR